MTVRLQQMLAAAAAVAVLVGGLGYGVTRPIEYESRASLFLVAATTDIGEASAVLDSLDSAGTVATYVELLASRDTLTEAGVSGIRLEVRAIPASRVIQLTARGAERRLHGALAAVLPVALRLPIRARDPWRLKILESPSQPVRAGMSPMMLVAVLTVASLLAALATFTIVGALRRAAWAPEEAAWPAPVPPSPFTNGHAPVEGAGASRLPRPSLH